MHSENLKTEDLEVGSQPRFEFGKNWQRFLRLVDQQRIEAAKSSLQQMLKCANLEGKTFLDVGSGSGLFSLAARWLGAKVVSFDYDAESVACALELKRTFFSGDHGWRIEQGSVLDRQYLGSLGRFDVVYSWGVLHHTVAMWDALENLLPLVKPGGALFIAIYNDQGWISDVWKLVKKTYNRTPAMLKGMILWPIGAFVLVGVTLKDIARFRRPRIFSKSAAPRGMSLWRDIVDWVGGYPFEVAAPRQIIDFYARRGFHLDRLIDCGRKSGCNQYVFIRAPLIPE